jgi:biotin transport system substrate-specific component
MELVLEKRGIFHRAVLKTGLCFLFVGLITAGSFIRVPLGFTPVPFTLQTFFVLICASFLGPAWGSFTQVVYVILGASGLSVFTGNGAGAFYFAGPTTGYLFGFIVSALFVGSSINKIKQGSFWRILGLFSAGSMIILACGTLWLKIGLNMDLARSFVLGFIPFIPGDLIKSAACSFIYMKFKKRRF